MKRFMFYLLLTLGFTARADVMVEAKMLGGLSLKTWTSGLKQRNEIPNPLLGNILVTITRVDKGVQWTLDTKLKVYDEKPIAIAYEKDSEEAKIVQTAKAGSAEKMPKIEVKKIAQPRSIAGFSAEGYEMLTGGKDSGAMWITPYTAMLERVEKETREFQEAHTKKLYEKFPAAERKELEAGMALMAAMMKGKFEGMSSVPKGYSLATEGAISSEGDTVPKRSTMYEVVSISAEKVNESMFSLPEGFKMVEDISSLQAQEMMKNMLNGKGEGVNMEEMLKNMPKGAASGATKPDE